MGCISCGWEKLRPIFFFFLERSNLGYLSHAKAEWFTCAHIAKRLDPTDELYFANASCLLHYEQQRHDEETICPPQDGDLDSQATKTLTVCELLLLLNGWTAEKATVLRYFR